MVLGWSTSCMNSSSSVVRLAAVSRSRPYMRPTKFKYSEPVSLPKSAMPSGTTPICRFTATRLLTRSRPRIWIRPAVGASNPVSILMVVDFPAPLGPRKPKNWPDATLRFTSSTATSSPKRRVRFSVEIVGESIKFPTLAQPQKPPDPVASASHRPSRGHLALGGGGGTLPRQQPGRGRYEPALDHLL